MRKKEIEKRKAQAMIFKNTQIQFNLQPSITEKINKCIVSFKPTKSLQQLFSFSKFYNIGCEIERDIVRRYYG